MVELAEEKKHSPNISTSSKTFSDVVRGGVVKMEKGGDKMKKEKTLDTGLIDTVFSWSLHDILNEKLYKHQVQKIPDTFSSLKHYKNSYIKPLIEETRADMCSAMMNLPHTPTREMSYVKESKEYKMPKDLYYDVAFNTSENRKNKRDTYKPQKWDVIAITNARPMCIDDLNRPPRHYLLALVVQGENDDTPCLPKILTVKPIFIKDDEEKQGTLFATFLINIVIV